MGRLYRCASEVRIHFEYVIFVPGLISSVGAAAPSWSAARPACALEDELSAAGLAESSAARREDEAKARAGAGATRGSCERSAGTKRFMAADSGANRRRSRTRAARAGLGRLVSVRSLPHAGMACWTVQSAYLRRQIRMCCSRTRASSCCRSLAFLLDDLDSTFTTLVSLAGLDGNATGRTELRLGIGPGCRPAQRQLCSLPLSRFALDFPLDYSFCSIRAP